MENKKEVVAPGKEESISLKENKVLPNNIGKKKKPKQISLQKLDLGTNPINISSSNEFLNINYIYNFIKARIKTFLFIVLFISVFIILFSLKDKLFHQDEDEEIEIKDINIPAKNVSLPSLSSFNSMNTSNITAPSSSSKKKED